MAAAAGTTTSAATGGDGEGDDVSGEEAGGASAVEDEAVEEGAGEVGEEGGRSSVLGRDGAATGLSGRLEEASAATSTGAVEEEGEEEEEAEWEGKWSVMAGMVFSSLGLRGSALTSTMAVTSTDERGGEEEESGAEDERVIPAAVGIGWEGVGCAAAVRRRAALQRQSGTTTS